MTDHRPTYDWDPRSDTVLDNPVASFDDMRQRCPVARSEYMGWSVFRHEYVLAVVTDHETFSNQVSQHRSVPNGLDQPEHTPYRTLIEPFFTDQRMAVFEPECRDIAAELALRPADPVRLSRLARQPAGAVARMGPRKPRGHAGWRSGGHGGNCPAFQSLYSGTARNPT